YTPLYSTAVWTGHPLSRDLTGFGGPTSGPIWRSYMEAAQGSDCPDWQIPSTMPELSGFYGGHSVGGTSSQSSSTGYSSSGGYTYSPTMTTPPTTIPSTSGSSSSGNYPSHLYAPGSGPQRPPSPG